MGVRKRFRYRDSGQMTIELVVALPVLIIVAAIAYNALMFFADCAVFDRAVNEAVRIYAASPAYGQSAERSCALAEAATRAALDNAALEVSVSCGRAALDLEAYEATLIYHPTLFGMGLRSEVLGVRLPSLTHTSSYVIDGYKSGVVI